MYIRYISDTQLQTVWISSFIISRLPPLGWKAAAGREHTAVLHSSLKAKPETLHPGSIVGWFHTRGARNLLFAKTHTSFLKSYVLLIAIEKKKLQYLPIRHMIYPKYAKCH